MYEGGGFAMQNYKAISLNALKVVGMGSFGNFFDGGSDLLGKSIYGSGLSLADSVEIQRTARAGLESLPLAEEWHTAKIADYINKYSITVSTAVFDLGVKQRISEQQMVLQTRLDWDNMIKHLKEDTAPGRNFTLSVGMLPDGANVYQYRVSTPTSITACSGWTKGQDYSRQCQTIYK
jgi:hypothetical protein